MTYILQPFSHTSLLTKFPQLANFSTEGVVAALSLDEALHISAMTAKWVITSGVREFPKAVETLLRQNMVSAINYARLELNFFASLSIADVASQKAIVDYAEEFLAQFQLDEAEA